MGMTHSPITSAHRVSRLVQNRLFYGIYLSLLLVCPMRSFGTADGSGIPVVTRLDPPNWWVGMPNPMLMISGEELAGASVRTASSEVKISCVEPEATGHYLFVWLDTSNARPGTVKLSLRTPKGSATASFPLQARNTGIGFQGFGEDDVIYLIMPDRFDDGDASNNFPNSGAYDRNSPRAYHGGDLRGIQQRLSYLKDLGVTTIWITPVYQNDDRSGRDYHGYGATDLYAVEKHLGTLADYQMLVTTAHQLGMKVLLDIVPNHVGPTNPWLDHPPTDHWFHGTRERHLATPSTFELITDPHAPFDKWKSVIEGWFANILPDMGTDDPVTAQYLWQNALWWAETGSLDGLRLDTFPYVDRKFWHDFHVAIHQTYPHFRTVGEVFNPDPTVTSYFVRGKTTESLDTGVDTVFDFPLFDAVRKVILQGASAGQLEDILRHDWMFPHPENLVTFIGNHDTKRFMSEPGATTQKLELAFSLLVTMRGIPQLYYGDEIGMRGGDDPDNRRDFPGGFPGDKHDAFTETGRTPEEQEVFLHIRTLLHLRQEHPALRRGKLFYVFSDDTVYAYVRDLSESGDGSSTPSSERLLMVMNNADQPRTLQLELSDTPAATTKSVTTLLGTNAAELVSGSRIGVSVPAHSLNIYRLN
jgi:glycosidase